MLSHVKHVRNVKVPSGDHKGGDLETLNLEQLDMLTLAMFANEELPQSEFIVGELIPFAEWIWLRRQTVTAHSVHSTGQLAVLEREIRSGQALSHLSMGAASGFIRIRRRQEDVENAAWIRFLTMFGHAALMSGLSKTLASQLAGVVKEMEDNVHAHSERPSSGLIAFVAHPSMFEFIVVDRGVGVMNSLRRAPKFAGLADHGKALQLAVSDGNSRFGVGVGRGYGFSDLTVGIANSNALIRFRTGDYLLELDGRGSGDIIPRCVQRAIGIGFLIAVQVIPC